MIRLRDQQCHCEIRWARPPVQRAHHRVADELGTGDDHLHGAPIGITHRETAATWGSRSYQERRHARPRCWRPQGTGSSRRRPRPWCAETPSPSCSRVRILCPRPPRSAAPTTRRQRPAAAPPASTPGAANRRSPTPTPSAPISSNMCSIIYGPTDSSAPPNPAAGMLKAWEPSE